MRKYILMLISFLIAGFLLSSCATTWRGATKPMTTAQISALQQGRRYFEAAYYRKAMRDLLPLACNGIPEAQYAVGYMYYYGYGVNQDKDVGQFWIRRAADQHYVPAIKALNIMSTQNNIHPRQKIKRR